MSVASHGLKDTSFNLNLKDIPYLNFDEIEKLRDKSIKLLDNILIRQYYNLDYCQAIE